MRPKGKLFALVAVFAAIAVVTASGAFTTATATRTADVTVAGDSSALIGLSEYSGPGGNADYVSTSNDQIEIDLSDLNLNATTEFNYVFTITYNGEGSVDVFLNKIGDNPEYVAFYNGSISDGDYINGSGNAETLSSGDSINVSIKVDTVGATVQNGDPLTASDNLLREIEINATAT